MTHARNHATGASACGKPGPLATVSAEVDCPTCQRKLLRGQAVVEPGDVVRRPWAKQGRRAFHGRPRRSDRSAPRPRVEALPAAAGDDLELDFSMMPAAAPKRAQPRRDPVRDFLVQLQGVVVGAGPALRAYDRRRR